VGEFLGKLRFYNVGIVKRTQEGKHRYTASFGADPNCTLSPDRYSGCVAITSACSLSPAIAVRWRTGMPYRRIEYDSSLVGSLMYIATNVLLVIALLFAPDPMMAGGKRTSMIRFCPQVSPTAFANNGVTTGLRQAAMFHGARQSGWHKNAR